VTRVLSIKDQREGDRHTLLLTGELDMASARELEEQAQRLCARPASELVLDLSRLEFIDSAGLNAILRVRALCHEHTCEFCLTPGARPVQRVFELTRLVDRLPFRTPPHPDTARDPSAPVGRPGHDAEPVEDAPRAGA
jgi:anti-sigma B factor antagonist